MIEREGEIREREVKGIERVKGAQSKILMKSPNPKIKRKERLITKIICDNYEQKLSGNYYRKL